MKLEARKDKKKEEKKKVVGAKPLRRHAHMSDHQKNDIVML
jgi:hypothetical protein